MQELREGAAGSIGGGGACTPTAPACLHLPEGYFIEEIFVSVNSLFNYLLLCFDSFSGASKCYKASACSLVVGPVSSLAFAAAVARNVAGSA